MRYRLLDRWTEPSTHLVSPQAQQKARDLARLMLFLLPTFLVIALVSIVSRREPLGLKEISTLAVVCAATATIYKLSRSRHYRIGAVLLTLTGILAPWGVALLETTPFRISGSLIFMVTGVAYAAFFLSLRCLFSSAFLVEILLALFPLAHANANFDDVVILMGVVAVVSLFLGAGVLTRDRFLGRIELHSKQMRQIIDDMPHCVAILRDGHILYTNLAMAQALGLPKNGDGELLPFISRVAQESRDDYERVLAGMLVDQDIRLHARGGKGHKDRIMNFAKPQVVFFEGAPALLLMATDVTDKREMVHQLLVSEAMATIGSVAAGVAHEINGPLSYVSSNLRYMAQHCDGMPDGTTERFEKVIEDTIEGVARIRGVVGLVKGLSHISDGGDERVDLVEVLESAARIAAVESKSRPRIDYGEILTPAWVKGSRSRLGQVFLNLLVNAIHALEKGKPQDPHIKIDLVAAGDNGIVVRIKDNGSGMSDSTKAQIFEPFFTTKNSVQGTGLGLAISLRIVSQMGGEITVHSALGEGTTFSVRLPHRLSAPLEAEDIPMHNAPKPVGLDSSLRILIIDDEPRISRALGRILRGHQVVTVATADEGLAATLVEDFDIVLCDLIMPDKTGADFFEAYSERFPHATERVVFMTGGLITDKTREFVRDVENHVLYKPFSQEQLQNAIHAVLSKQNKSQTAIRDKSRAAAPLDELAPPASNPSFSV